jgi:hypothetical protein
MSQPTLTEESTKTEVWFRNPVNYIRELVQVPGGDKIAWDRGMLMKRGVDPHAFGNLYFGRNSDWRALAIGEQGAAEVDFEHSMSNPMAVYPVLVYGEDDLGDLEDWMKHPLGEDANACARRNAPADEVPVFGQEHRIVITNLPGSSLSSTKFLLRTIKEMKEDYDYTGVILHLHNSYAYRQMFALNFGSVDIDPRTEAAKGKVTIPPGKTIRHERASNVAHWVNLLDMTPADLKVPANRCIYNIKSALWAGENWTTDVKFRHSSPVDLDPRDLAIRQTRGSKIILSGKGKQTEQPGDKVVCNACSLQDACKYYREDAVCSVPDSEMSILAKYFRSRDADTVIDAIGTVLAAQAQRLERGVKMEEDYGELDPEVTKIANQVFNNGAKLAKLLDPSLSKPSVQISVGGASGGSVGSVNPKQLISKAVRAIQDETGMALEDITSDMIVAMMARQGTPVPVAIEQGEPEE